MGLLGMNPQSCQRTKYHIFQQDSKPLRNRKRHMAPVAIFCTRWFTAPCNSSLQIKDTANMKMLPWCDIWYWWRRMLFPISDQRESLSCSLTRIWAWKPSCLLDLDPMFTRIKRHSCGWSINLNTCVESNRCCVLRLGPSSFRRFWLVAILPTSLCRLTATKWTAPRLYCNCGPYVTLTLVVFALRLGW